MLLASHLQILSTRKHQQWVKRVALVTIEWKKSPEN